jgi:RNA polymerase sigma-70 factor (ECF subfamily)
MNAEPLEVLLDRMCAGDLRAAGQVFAAYEPQLRRIVRRQLSRRLRAKLDSLDVVQSVWAHVLRDFQKSGCRITSTTHLHHFLVRTTRNCLTDRLRHFRTALSCEQPLTEADLTNPAAPHQARPSEVAQANELWDNLLAVCPPAYHPVLQLKRQGMRLADIAARTGLHTDSIRRILRKLARQLAFAAEEPTA